MNAKDKAKELVYKYWRDITYNDEEYEPNGEAKECAKLAVDEVIKALDNEPDVLTLKKVFTYWKEVKNEIEKL